MNSLFAFFHIDHSVLNADVRNTIISLVADYIFLDSTDLSVNEYHHSIGTRWIACKNGDVVSLLYTHHLPRFVFFGHIDKDLMLIQTHLKQWYNLYGWPVFSVNGVIYDKRYIKN